MATVVQYNKYKRLKKQVSVDNGVTWNDVTPAEYMTGELIEVNSRDCGYSVAYVWDSQTIEGAIVSVEKISYNNGKVWESTGNIKVNGAPINMTDAISEFGEPLEAYLNTLNRNVNNYIDSIEENNNNGGTDTSDPSTGTETGTEQELGGYTSMYLYQKWVKHQGQTNFVPAWPVEYSIYGDGGVTTIKNEHDPECGYNPSVEPIYRWIEDGYVCKEETVEVDTLYRWVDSGRYVCVNGSKYALQIRQKSDDNGVTWTDVSPAEYQRGGLIETDSTDCKNLLDADYYFEAAGEYQLANDRGGVVNDVWVDGENIDFSGQNITYTETEAHGRHVNFALRGNQVPSYMFDSNIRLNTVNIPSKFTNIGFYAFSGCTDLKNVTMSGVTSINIGAFANCTNLERIEFPATLTSIDDEAFRNCQALDTLTFYGDVPPVITETTFAECRLGDIFVTQNAYPYFINDEVWSRYEKIISIMS